MSRCGSAVFDKSMCLQLLDENEEILLHVFGGTLPLTYELGRFQVAHMDAVHLQAAVSQADQLLKVYSLLIPVADLHWCLT